MDGGAAQLGDVDHPKRTGRISNAYLVGTGAHRRHGLPVGWFQSELHSAQLVPRFASGLVRERLQVCKRAAKNSIGFRRSSTGHIYKLQYEGASRLRRSLHALNHFTVVFLQAPSVRVTGACKRADWGRSARTRTTSNLEDVIPSSEFVLHGDPEFVLPNSENVIPDLE